MDDRLHFLERRELLKLGSAAAATALLPGSLLGDDSKEMTRPDPPELIVDTHQHLWSLDRFKLSWITPDDKLLHRNYETKDYLAATRGLNVRTIYMEVDVDPRQHLVEAEHVVGLCKSDAHPTIAAVVGGRPADDGFAAYVRKLKKHPQVVGVRQVLHAQPKRGLCLSEPFVRGVRLLGENGLRFDLCMKPEELADGAALARKCPDTTFIVDHCGNADPKLFAKKVDAQSAAAADAWRREMDSLAKLDNVACKISGIVARAPKGWKPDDLAPVVNHCLDAFGPERVVFGGDWPVCLMGAPLRDWIDALGQIVANRPADQQKKLWSGNAEEWYGVKVG